MARPGSASASICVIRRASHSREAELVSLMTSLASTGIATGRRTAGSLTTTAAITQLLPYPVFAGPGADPSWNQEAAQTFLPRRRNSVSSIATLTGCPAGTSSPATRRATARPSSSGLHRAREKNQCARSCGQARDRPAPASIPHTVLLPVWARNPQARPQKVRNDGAVNSGPNTASRPASEPGSGSVTSGIIAGNPGTRVPAVARPDSPGHHEQRARHARPADPRRRHPADHRPRQAWLARYRRAHRAPPRTILLRLRPPARLPRARADPATALPGLTRPMGHRDLPGQQRPVHRSRAAHLIRAQDRHPRRRGR